MATNLFIQEDILDGFHEFRESGNWQESVRLWYMEVFGLPLFVH